MMNFIIATWKGLNSSERRILSWGAAVLFSIAYYGILLSPLLKERAQLNKRLDSEKEFYQTTYKQVKTIIESGIVQKKQTVHEMDLFVQSSLENYKLSPINKPKQHNEIWHMRFESIDAAIFFAWLKTIAQKGFYVVQFSLKKDKGSKTVTVEDLKLSRTI